MHSYVSDVVRLQHNHIHEMFTLAKKSLKAFNVSVRKLKIVNVWYLHFSHDMILTSPIQIIGRIKDMPVFTTAPSLIVQRPELSPTLGRVENVGSQGKLASQCMARSL